MRPTWVEVNLSALRHNFRVLQQYVAPNVTVCCVVKADAYSHGVVECATALEAGGASWFAVTSTEEGIALRRAGLNGRILLLTGFWRGDVDDAILHDLTPAVWERWHIDALEEAYKSLGWRVHGSVPVHLKFDSGMARLGLQPGDLPQFLAAVQRSPHVRLEGVFSHFASSEIIDAPSNDEQQAAFERAIAQIRAAGQNPAYYHIGNSAAIITRRRSWYNMVRPGLALYGYVLPPASCADRTGAAEKVPELMQASALPELPLRPVLSWMTRIIALKDVPAGSAIGYGGTYVTQGPARIAQLAVGYADGLSRLMSSNGRVIVRDRYAPIIGNVAMDLTTVDITGISGVSVGDEVTIIGSTEHCSISAWEHARLSATIPYEVLCSIGRRVPRVYVE
jgi:alanine racemase